MPKQPAYVILGRGRWARQLHRILTPDRACTYFSETRRHAEENDAAYEERLASALRASRAQIAWICVSPGPHTLAMIRAAVGSGLHVIVEKPWLFTGEGSRALILAALQQQVVIGVHYEYCLLSQVEKWRKEFQEGRGLQFEGSFRTRRPNRSGISPFENLGSHLFSIHTYAVPQAAISDLSCAYNAVEEERTVRLTGPPQLKSVIDFTVNTEPIIQRFIGQFEAALEGAPFTFDLGFAARVFESMARFRERPRPSSQPDAENQ